LQSKYPKQSSWNSKQPSPAKLSSQCSGLQQLVEQSIGLCTLHSLARLFSLLQQQLRDLDVRRRSVEAELEEQKRAFDKHRVDTLNALNQEVAETKKRLKTEEQLAKQRLETEKAAIEKEVQRSVNSKASCCQCGMHAALLLITSAHTSFLCQPIASRHCASAAAQAVGRSRQVKWQQSICAAR
jgi:ABC-type anion transport system duplicated permease subunit